MSGGEEIRLKNRGGISRFYEVKSGRDEGTIGGATCGFILGNGTRVVADKTILHALLARGF